MMLAFARRVRNDADEMPRVAKAKVRKAAKERTLSAVFSRKPVHAREDSGAGSQRPRLTIRDIGSALAAQPSARVG